MPDGVVGQLRAVGFVFVVVALQATAISSQAPGEGAELPSLLLGDFVDDYGFSYAISRQVWAQGDDRYEIAEWDVGRRRILVRDATGGADGVAAWIRIDWVVLDAGPEEYAWAYCYAAYDALTADAAMSVPASSGETPRTGCNGFPFSRMRPVP